MPRIIEEASLALSALQGSLLLRCLKVNYMMVHPSLARTPANNNWRRLHSQTGGVCLCMPAHFLRLSCGAWIMSTFKSGALMPTCEVLCLRQCVATEATASPPWINDRPNDTRHSQPRPGFPTNFPHCDFTEPGAESISRRMSSCLASYKCSL